MSAPEKGAFRARIDHVEDGLFRASYRGDLKPVDGRAPKPAGDVPGVLPDTHIGTDLAAVKFWVQEVARGQGYQQVEWEALPPETPR